MNAWTRGTASEIGRGMMAVMAASLMVAGAAGADEPSDAALKADIEVLKTRLQKLESQVENRTVPPTGSEASNAFITLPSGLQNVQISGYADVSYIYNWNRPDAATGRTNRGRAFDTQSNGFTPQAFNLAIERPLDDAIPVGFRADLLFGDDAEVIHSTGLGTGGAPSDSFDLEQLYVTAKAPVGDGITFKAGKFVTLLGAEVIRSQDDWNFSRSMLFTYAIPFTHTGVLASYPLGEWGSVTGGVVNGWDIVDENNQFKTMIGSLALTPIKDVNFSVNGVTGAERAGDNRNDRSVIDLVATWKALDMLTLMANYDYGHESSMAHGVTGTAGFDSANWEGVDLYAKYDLSPKWSLAGRWGWFNDMDNVRAGFTGPGGTLLINGVNYFDYTFTSQWQLYQHLLARLEYRHDDASERVYFRRGDGFSEHQDTIATEFIYTF